MRREVLRAEQIHKTIHGSQVLRGLNLTVYEHEILGMAGLSGSGKSAAAEILSGSRAWDSGRIWISGGFRNRGEERTAMRELESGNRRQAAECGIFHIRETPSLFSCLSVEENICLTERDFRSSLHFPSRRQSRTVWEAARSLELDMDLSAPVDRLSLYERRQIMILRAYYLHARLIILDNITDGCTEEEFHRLAGLLLRLKRRDMGILMMESMPERVMPLADRMVILRNGRDEGLLFPEEYEVSGIRRIMMGDYQAPRIAGQAARNREEERDEAREILFSVRHLRGRRLEDGAFYLKKGEVIGLIDEEEGLCTEVLSLFQGTKAEKGIAMEMDGRPLPVWSNQAEMIRAGIGYVDAYKNSIFPKRSLKDNLTAASLDRLTSRTMIHRRLERMVAGELLFRLGIPAEHMKLPMKDVSNQEQLTAALYRWILSRSRMVVLNNVLSGTDLLMKNIVVHFLNELRERQCGAVVFSPNPKDVFELCDRVYVLRDGRLQEYKSAMLQNAGPGEGAAVRCDPDGGIQDGAGHE